MATSKKKTDAAPSQAFVWPFGRKNYVLFGVSLVIIIIGYICLGYGDDPNNAVSLTIAPILLVLGYALVPFAILIRDKSSGPGSKDAESAEPAEAQE